jgi:hypothetical protein
MSRAIRRQVAWRITFDVVGGDAVECHEAAEATVDRFFARSERAVVLELDVSPLVAVLGGEVSRWKAECLAVSIERNTR